MYESLPGEVFKLARDLRNAMDRELVDYGLTTQQATVLVLARVHGEGGIGHLAEPLGTDTAGLTRLIDRLEAKGLVARRNSERDRRAVVIELTPAGEALLPHLTSAFRRVHQRLQEAMPAEHLEQFQESVRRLREKAQA
ncbi:MAG TPA: MarR family transcriptional regulator [Candidatus Dormibacteraeota bacterium]